MGLTMDEYTDNKNYIKNKFSWEEIKKHDKKDDRWLVIDGQVYDVTKWSKRHPGGPRLIGHFAGQDATDAFGAFHNDMDKVKKYLKVLHIGEVDNYEVKDIDEDFRKLRETATKMDLFRPSFLFYAVNLGHVALLFLLSYYVLVWYGSGWIPYLISLALVSTAQAQIGWNQHDFGHLSVFKNSKIDHAMHQLCIGFIKGASSSWWNHLHFQHHAKPNVIGKDPDVRLDALFVVGEEMPVNVAKTRKKSMPFNLQHRYFFALGPPLLFPVYFQIMLIQYIISRKQWMELCILMAFFTTFFSLYGPQLGVTWVLIYYFSMRCIESHWFVWITQSNHIPMTIKSDQYSPWLKLQLSATCNVEKSFFNDWFTGHLNFQIEHHLFPTMPRHNLYKIAPMVRSLCEKHNVPYTVKPLWQSFVDIVKQLKSSGELWEETYREYHSG